MIFMKKLLVLLLSLACLSLIGCASNAKKDEKSPRKVAVQMWTFNKYTFEDALKMLKGSGIQGIECYPGQRLSDSMPDVKISPAMTAEQKKLFKKLLDESGFKLIAFGVISPKDEKGIEEVCEFAKEFQIPVIVSESPINTYPTWDKYCDKYGIKMAIHNHQKPNPYYDPSKVMSSIDGFKNIGVCADNGAWECSDIKSVDGFKTVKGKIVEVHFKDIKKGTKEHIVVPYGTGKVDVKGSLAELDSQNFDGWFVIEHGNKEDDIAAIVREDVEFMRKN